MQDIYQRVFCTYELFSYGLPPLSNVPDGFSALTEIYGKSGDRSPLLVSFGFPLDWVVTLPSQDVNGEAGTIQAGEYAKGDTATFFIVPGEGKASVSGFLTWYAIHMFCTNLYSPFIKPCLGRTFMTRTRISSSQL